MKNIISILILVTASLSWAADTPEPKDPAPVVQPAETPKEENKTEKPVVDDPAPTAEAVASETSKPAPVEEAPQDLALPEGPMGWISFITLLVVALVDKFVSLKKSKKAKGEKATAMDFANVALKELKGKLPKEEYEKAESNLKAVAGGVDLLEKLKATTEES